MYACQNRPLIVELYRGIDARLGITIKGEHQRMGEQIVVRSELRLNVRWRNVATNFNDHTLRDVGNVQKSVDLYRVKSVQTVVLQ